jgi:hypothetical protein
MILYRFGGTWFNSCFSVTPTVKSSIASQVVPPFRASYDPCNFAYASSRRDSGTHCALIRGGTSAVHSQWAGDHLSHCSATVVPSQGESYDAKLYLL